MNNDARMIEAQAARITVLNETITSLNRQIVTFDNKYVKPALFYHGLIEIINESDIAKEEWDRFLMFLKMTVPDAEERLKRPKQF